MVYIALAVSAGLIVLDQVIKLIVDLNMTEGASIPLWDGVLHLTYLKNTGAAFGIFEGQGWLLAAITCVVMAFCVYLLLSKKVKHNFLIWSIALVIAGGFGNLIDRVFRQFVIDYIEVRIIHFAIFNFADCCVVIGTIGLVAYLLLGDLIKKKRLAKVTPTETTPSQNESVSPSSAEVDWERLEQDDAE